MATSVKLWKEVWANSSHETAASQPIPLYCEWLRLLVGRSLALASFSDSKLRYKYLILGVDLTDLKDDEYVNRNLINALEADLMVLQAALESCKQSLRDNSPIESPEIFLRSFSILAMLRLPQESKDWVLTDEGLTIIHWGLKSGRLFFEWNESQFEQIKKDLLQRIRTSRSGNVSSTSTSRDAQEESRQQAKLNSAAHKSVPSPAVPVKAATNIPVTSVNNTKQPVSSIQSDDNTPTWLLALVALCLIIIGGILGVTAYKFWSRPKSNETQVITEPQKSDYSSESAGDTIIEEPKPKADKKNKNPENGPPSKTKSNAPQKPDHSGTSRTVVQPASAPKPPLEVPPASAPKPPLEVPPAPAPIPPLEVPPASAPKPPLEVPPAPAPKPPLEVPPAPAPKPPLEVPPAPEPKPPLEVPPASGPIPPLEVPSSGTSPTAVPQGHSNQQPKSPKSLKADHHQSQELST